MVRKQRQAVNKTSIGYELPDHHSASSLNTFRDCPERYRLTYLTCEVPDKDSTAAIQGRAFHKAVEITEKRGNMMRLFQTAYQQYDRISRESVEANGPENIETYGKPLLPDLARRREVLHEQCKTYFVSRRQDSRLILESEKSFSIRPKGVRKPVIGFIDQILKDNTGIMVRDLKTGSRKSSSALQLAVYRAAILEEKPIINNVSPYGEYWYGKDGSTHRLDLSKQTPPDVWDNFAALERAIIHGIMQPRPSGDCYICPAKKVCREAWKTR